MIILSGWIGLSVLNAVVFAALGRAGLDEDRALGYLPGRSRETVLTASEQAPPP
jgi:hypothetical protein